MRKPGSWNGSTLFRGFASSLTIYFRATGLVREHWGLAATTFLEAEARQHFLSRLREHPTVERTLSERLEVTVHSNPVVLSLFWRHSNSFDDFTSAFEVPPATYNNLQGSGSTNRAGTQNTRQSNTQNALSVHTAQTTVSQRCVHYRIQMVQH